MITLNNHRHTTTHSNTLPFVVKCGKHKLYGYQKILIFVLYVINGERDEWYESGVVLTPFHRSPNPLYRYLNIYVHLES